jgi:hypothetical protein
MSDTASLAVFIKSLHLTEEQMFDKHFLYLLEKIA